jgi:hypoxanthine-DNA glycosylase
MNKKFVCDKKISFYMNDLEEIETHPFKAFIPENATIIILGTFPGKDITHKELSEDDWFYGTKRNQFWKIISGVYETELLTKKDKQDLFKKHGIGIADLFLKVKRTGNNNTDSNLKVIQFNDKELKAVLENRAIKKVFFTSKFVEKTFLKLFPACAYGECLPSPSPRFATMSLTEKIKNYKIKLPK